MVTTVAEQDIANGARDLADLALIVNGGPSLVVPTRYGGSVRSLQNMVANAETEALQARDDAIAAAEASGIQHIALTYAAAEAESAGYALDDKVLVLQDEGHDDTRHVYKHIASGLDHVGGWDDPRGNRNVANPTHMVHYRTGGPASVEMLADPGVLPSFDGIRMEIPTYETYPGHLTTVRTGSCKHDHVTTPAQLFYEGDVNAVSGAEGYRLRLETTAVGKAAWDRPQTRVTYDFSGFVLHGDQHNGDSRAPIDTLFTVHSDSVDDTDGRNIRSTHGYAGGGAGLTAGAISGGVAGPTYFFNSWFMKGVTNGDWSSTFEMYVRDTSAGNDAAGDSAANTRKFLSVNGQASGDIDLYLPASVAATVNVNNASTWSMLRTESSTGAWGMGVNGDGDYNLWQYDGAAGERLSVSSDAVKPGIGGMDLGGPTGTAQWDNIFLVSDPVVSCDRDTKKPGPKIERDTKKRKPKKGEAKPEIDTDKAYLAGLAILDDAMLFYQLKTAIEKKGEEGARWHYGPEAQAVWQAFDKRGVDPERVGICCFDKWPETHEPVMVLVDVEEVRKVRRFSPLNAVEKYTPFKRKKRLVKKEVQQVDADGKPVYRVTRDAGQRFGVRLVQLALFLATVQHRARLEDRERFEKALTAVNRRLAKLEKK